MSRDRAEYTKVETRDFGTVQVFFEQNKGKLEMAELTVRSSAGTFIAELRPTDEPNSWSARYVRYVERHALGQIVHAGRNGCRAGKVCQTRM